MSEQKGKAVTVVATINTPEFKKRVADSVPPGVNVDRFTRMTITAIQEKPELLEADKDSLYLAILRCAQTGLAPDGKESALVVFNTNVAPKGAPAKWVKKVQFMPMVTGIIKKLGEVDCKCDTAVVHENDLFDWEQGDHPSITHKPAKLGTDRGLIIGAYAILRVKGIDTPYHEVMDTKQIEKIRAQSKSPNSLMWTQFYDEACRKSALRRCSKRVPLKFDPSVEATLQADNDTFEFDENLKGVQTPEEAQEPAKPDPTVVAQIEKKTQENDAQTIQQSVKQPEKGTAQKTAEKPVAPTRAVTDDKQEEAARAAWLAEEAKKTPPPQYATTSQAAKPRPRALAAVAESKDEPEDIF